MNILNAKAVKAKYINSHTANAKDDTVPITPQMQSVLDYIEKNGRMTEEEIGELLGLKKTRTFMVAKRMRDLGLIRVIGRGKNKYYT